MNLNIKEQHIKLILSTVLAAVIFGIYWNSTSGSFVWDDLGIIKRNPLIRDLSHLGDLLTNDLLYGYSVTKFYRPLQAISNLIDYHIWGLNPFGYHITNIVMHSAMIISVFYFIYIILKDVIVSFVTALLYGIHPIHTEAVAYISGRADIMAGFFMIMALNLYYIYRKNLMSKYKWMSIASFVLALFSKEIALIYLPLFMLFKYCIIERYHQKDMPEKKTNGSISYLWIIVLIYVAYAILRLKLGMQGGGQSIGIDPVIKMIYFFKAFASYLIMIFYPFNLHMERTLVASIDVFFVISCLVFLTFIYLTYRYQKRTILILFSSLWFIINFLPISNIFALNAPLAEHWIYIASVSIFGLLSYGLVRWVAIPSFFRWVVIGIFTLYFSVLTINQNKIWTKPIELYQYLLKFSPENKRVLNNLAEEYIFIKDYDKAEKILKQSLKLFPEEFGIMVNLAVVYQDTGRIEEAVKQYKTAIKINPNVSTALYNLANLYRMNQMYKKSIVYFKRAIKADPYFDSSYLNLGHSYHRLGDNKRAIYYWRKTLEVNPNNQKAIAMLRERGAL